MVWRGVCRPFLSLWILLCVTDPCNGSLLPWASSSATSTRPLIIGTRGSPLALAQAEEAKTMLQKYFPQLKNRIEILKIMTQGDSILNQPLSEIGGKGLFTKELDQALLDHQVDICVHSMKDVPTWLPNGTILACYLPREETNDVFISKRYKSLADLPNGAVIGSASLRRQAQLLAINPTFKVINFRGNVQTRLQKLEKNEVDGTLLALAGLKRLGMSSLLKTSQILSQEEMLPAVSQGAIGIQCRENDSEVKEYLLKLNDHSTQLAVECERAFLETLDGNCRTPIAGQAKVMEDKGKKRKVIHFRGMLLKADGSELISIEKIGDVSEHKEIGRRAGEEIKMELGEEKFEEFRNTFLTSEVDSSSKGRE